MGLFDFLKKKQETPASTLKNGTAKTFDYFAFKVNGVASAPGRQEVLAGLGAKLHEQPSFVKVVLENDVLNVYVNGVLIGTGDAQAKAKYIENCKSRYEIQSLSVYGGDDGKSYGCKVRIKYYY